MIVPPHWIFTLPRWTMRALGIVGAVLVVGAGAIVAAVVF